MLVRGACMGHLLWVADQPRVLVIDDHELVRKALRRHLEAAGCLVRGAKDGREGLAETLEWEPHVVIVDRRLPKLSGDDLAKLIMQQAKYPPGIIMLTGEPTHSLGPMREISRLFTKPVDFGELYAAMKPYLPMDGPPTDQTER